MVLVDYIYKLAVCGIPYTTLEVRTQPFKVVKVWPEKNTSTTLELSPIYA